MLVHLGVERRPPLLAEDLPDRRRRQARRLTDLAIAQASLMRLPEQLRAPRVGVADPHLSVSERGAPRREHVARVTGLIVRWRHLWERWAGDRPRRPHARIRSGDA